MTSRCIAYKQSRCLIEVTTPPPNLDGPHVAHVYLVDHGDEGDIVRPLVDLDDHPLAMLGSSASMAIRSARRVLRRLFGAPLAVLRPCGLGSASLGLPVRIADPVPDTSR